MKKSHSRLFVCACVALLAVALLRPVPAAAVGALAVGMPDDVAHQGVSFGFIVNQSDAQDASDKALYACRTFEHTTDIARQKCRVVRTFSNYCMAITMDPADGTPGVGYAFGADSDTAAREAMRQCIATAGASRREYCQVSAVKCDGSAH